MIGRDLRYDYDLSAFERFYITLFGAPISGLRIRCRRILPKIHSGFERILDVGSGTGVLSLEIAKRLKGATVIGIDTNAELTEKGNVMARKSGLTNCMFLTMDVLRISMKQRFDLAICSDNLEHIEDDVSALKAIHHVLEDKGVAIIHVPAYNRRWLFFGKRVNFPVPGHVRPGYKINVLAEKLKAAGFVVQEIAYTYGALETISNNLSYLLTRAERKNKYLYAVLFPFLNMMAYFGRNSKPAEGAGILAVVKKDEDNLHEASH